MALWGRHPKDASQPLQGRGAPQELHWATSALHTSELHAASIRKGPETLALELLSYEMGLEKSRGARLVDWGV